MAQRSVTSFKATKDSRYPDNTSGLVTAADSRDSFEDVADSFVNWVDGVVDEDNMSSNSDTKVPTQQSVKAYIDTHIKYTDFQLAGNTGTSETLLSGGDISGRLNNNGESLHFEFYGKFAANGNSKTLRLKFSASGSPLTLMTSALTQNDGGWAFFVDIFRTGASSAKIAIRHFIPTAVVYHFVDASQDLSDDTLSLTLTGQGEATNDIVKHIMKCSWKPVNNYQS